jgi:hypothetical protein
MLTGINNILQEAMHKGTLEELRLTGAALLAEKSYEYPVACVLVATTGSRALRNALKTFAGKFHDTYAQYYARPEYVAPFQTASILVEECFLDFR